MSDDDLWNLILENNRGGTPATGLEPCDLVFRRGSMN
jgi:hypothetical protein